MWFPRHVQFLLSICELLLKHSFVLDQQGPSILESSIERLKIDYERLSTQNESFRAVLVAFAMSLDRLSRHALLSQSDRPSRPVTDLTLFPPSQQPWKDDADNARKALQDLLSGLEAVVRQDPSLANAASVAETNQATAQRETLLKEKLETEVATLRAELGMCTLDKPNESTIHLCSGRGKPPGTHRANEWSSRDILP